LIGKEIKANKITTHLKVNKKTSILYRFQQVQKMKEIYVNEYTFLFYCICK